MKQRVLALGLALFFVLSCVNLFAHSGGTDGAGGHYNHSTGEYHYHHGYSAHQHPGGVCPYDYDDRTGENSGSSSSTSKNYAVFGETAAPKPTITPKPTATPTATPQPTATATPPTTKKSSTSYYYSPLPTPTPIANTIDEFLEAPFVATVVFSNQAFWIITGVIFITIWVLYTSRKGAILGKQIAERKTREAEDRCHKLQQEVLDLSMQVSAYKAQNAALEHRLKDITNRAVNKVNTLLQERNDLQQLLLEAPQVETDMVHAFLMQQYGHKNAEDLAGMPNDTIIGADGLPKEKDSPPGSWGKKYTVYKSPNGYTFHNCMGCSQSSYIQIHVLQTDTLTPCKRCKPAMPDLRWYADYKRIKEIKERYNIP